MESYHDYVIKDGKWVGEFESMYQKFDDPWCQSEERHNILSKPRNAAILNMLSYNIQSVVEVGCGLGFFSDLIRRRTGAKVIGIDISPTAIQKARTRFPIVEFHVDTVDSLEKYRHVEAVLFSEVTWYLLPQLQEVYTLLSDFFRGKYFLHNLVFYPADKQKYGREYFTCFEEFAKGCPFELLEWSINRSSDPNKTIETSAIFRIR